MLGRHIEREINLIRILVAMLCLPLALPATAQQSSPPTMNEARLTDDRGFINVWQLRNDAIKVEAAEAFDDTTRCHKAVAPDTPPPSRKERMHLIRQKKECVKQVKVAFKKYQILRKSFNTKWQGALRAAVQLGDPVAEVIWRQCNTTPVIERSALASTCDKNVARRKEAAQRLQDIGFEAALDEDTQGDLPANEFDQGKHLMPNLERTIQQMAAGVYGGLSIDNRHGGYAPRNPDELEDIRRTAVIVAASNLAQRSFTYTRIQGAPGEASHAQLRLNRKPLGAPALTWSANVFRSGHPYTGPYDPMLGGMKVYLSYDKHREVIVGGKHDAKYIRMLHETLKRSEQRIDDWLKRDSRWSIFLLHRRGHHEWVPEGMESSFGRLDTTWEGQWVLDKKYINFKLENAQTTDRLRIRASGDQALALFENPETLGYVCELRYSGATSLRPDNSDHVQRSNLSAIGYLSNIAPIGRTDREPLAPMNPLLAYRQVLVQCPQGEWPDNRNKRFLFLANDTIVEIRMNEGSQDFVILHWRRDAPLEASAQFSPPSLPFNLQQMLTQLAREAVIAEQESTQAATPPEKREAIDVDALIASLAQTRLERAFYDSKIDFPDNLKELIETPYISLKLCAIYRSNPPPDALQRFNFMVILNKVSRGWGRGLTPMELSVVPDCLRLALDDQHPWVRLEAVDAFYRFVEKKDLPKLMEMQKDSNADIRQYSHFALSRLIGEKETR